MELKLTDAEKKRLRKLRDEADEYYELYNAYVAMAAKLSSMRMNLFGAAGAFEKFWAPIRKREIDK